MIDYRMQRRLSYIGGGIQAQMSAWPNVGANWWEPTTGSFTCVAAYQAKGAASLAASYVNLANPGTYDAAPGDAPTFDTTTGWAFPGANKYLTTGIVPNGGAYTGIVRFINGALASYAYFGTQSSAGTIFAIFSNVGAPAGHYYNNGGSSYRKTPHIGSGVLAVAGYNAAYRNGTAETGTINEAWSGTLTHALYIGARNNAGTTDQYCNANILAVAIYSTTLDATQVAEVSAAMAAL